MRAIDSFTQNSPLVGEWATLTFTLLPAETPTISTLQLEVAINDPEHGDTSSNPELMGVVDPKGSVTQLLIEFDHNNDNLPDGVTTADFLGNLPRNRKSGAFFAAEEHDFARNTEETTN